MSDTSMNVIIVGVDGSPAAHRATAFAGKLAQATDAELILAFVFELSGTARMGLRHVSNEEFQHTVDAIGRPILDRAKDDLGPAMRERARDRIAIGDPAGSLLSLAKELDADLLVVGTRGMSPIKELVVGSVSDKLIRFGSCPVTVVA